MRPIEFPRFTDNFYMGWILLPPQAEPWKLKKSRLIFRLKSMRSA
jgi:hypothetical protein